MKLLKSTPFQVAAVVLLAGLWKALLLRWQVTPFNADEAVVALMARHILMGERPVFFYGQAYMGSLDAFLVAGGFWLFGQQVWVIRLVQSLLYLGTVLTTARLGARAFQEPRVGLLAAAMLAIPTVNMTLYTTASLGGYGEALLLGNLILLQALALVRGRAAASAAPAWAGFGLWGILAGLGLWANGLTLVYSLPAGVYLLWHTRRQRRWLPFVLLAGAGMLLGALPWWVYALQHGPSRLVLELLGTAVAVETEAWPVRTLNHLASFLLLGLTVLFGLRPPWGVTWLGLPLLPFVLIFWLAVLVFFFRKLSRPATHRAEYALLAGVVGTLLAGFLLTPFGADPSGRYFLPLSIPLALVAAQWIRQVPRRRWQAVGLLALVVGYQLWGNLQCALQFPPGFTTQFYEPTIIDHRDDAALVDFLRRQGETRGYSNYWVAYPLAFQSGEELIFVPRLPYHLDLRYAPRDDRYAPYTRLVEESPRVAYISTRNPNLDAYLRERMSALGVTWREAQIGDYRVYFHLSRAVRPQEMDLGDVSE